MPGSVIASQKVALQQLIQYLKVAERGDLTGLLKLMEDDDTHGEMDPFVKPHPNAVLLEAILLLESLHRGTGRSMVGYANAALRDFDQRPARPSGIYIPRPS